MSLLKKYAQQKIFIKLLVSFLLVGILPLMLAWSVYYAISYTILEQDTGNKTYESTRFVSLQLDKMILENSKIIDAIESEAAFSKVFVEGNTSILDDNDRADLYNILYLLSAEEIPKVGIYVMNTSGSNILSTKPIPAEYDPKKFHDWGLFRKASSNRGKTILYPYKVNEKNGKNRVLSLCKAVFSGDLQVGYIILDLYREHFAEVVSSPANPNKLNINIFDANQLQIFNSIEPPKKEVLRNFTRIAPAKTKPFTLFKDKKQPFLFSSYQSKETGLYIVGVQELNQLISVVRIILLPFLILAAITTFISLFLAFFVARSFSKPLYEIIKCVTQVQEGDFTARTAIRRKDEFAILGNSVNDMVVKIQELITSIQQKERGLRVSEMKALQAQIHPHLIFNTLEMIKWNIRLNNSDEASHMIVQLAKLLRQGIDNKNELVTVDEEITIVEIYLDIQKHRFEDKLKTEIVVESEIKQAHIPKFIIQPIVENAVIHGLKNTIDMGSITIKGYGIGKDIYFEIIDNGQGIDEKKIQQILNDDVDYDDKPKGTGMQNVMKRIKLYCGNECGLRIESGPYQGTKIVLKMRNDVIN